MSQAPLSQPMSWWRERETFMIIDCLRNGNRKLSSKYDTYSIVLNTFEPMPCNVMHWNNIIIRPTFQDMPYNISPSSTHFRCFPVSTFSLAGVHYTWVYH